MLLVLWPLLEEEQQPEQPVVQPPRGGGRPRPRLTPVSGPAPPTPPVAHRVEARVRITVTFSGSVVHTPRRTDDAFALLNSF